MSRASAEGSYDIGAELRDAVRHDFEAGFAATRRRRRR